MSLSQPSLGATTNTRGQRQKQNATGRKGAKNHDTGTPAMTLAHLIDGPSAAIVIGGTLLSTLMRTGWRDAATTLSVLGSVSRSHFAALETRAKLARQVGQIREDGLLRAARVPCGDAEFDEGTDAMVSHRCVAALLETHEAYKARRQEIADTAVRTLAQAAELAPAFGLVGTLFSLSQLPSGGIAPHQLTGAISLAVLTTLYGLLTANLVYAPLARMVARAAEQEERGRQEVIDWLASQLAETVPLHETVVESEQHHAAPRRARKPAA